MKEVSVLVRSVNPELSQQLDQIVTDKENIPTSTTTLTSPEMETQLNEGMISSTVMSGTQGKYVCLYSVWSATQKTINTRAQQKDWYQLLYYDIVYCEEDILYCHKSSI